MAAPQNTGANPVIAGAAQHIEGTVNIVVDVDIIQIGETESSMMCAYCCCDVMGIYYKFPECCVVNVDNTCLCNQNKCTLGYTDDGVRVRAPPAFFRRAPPTPAFCRRAFCGCAVPPSIPPRAGCLLAPLTAPPYRSCPATTARAPPSTA